MSAARQALPALLVGLSGVVLAWLVFALHPLILVAPAIVLVVGEVAFRVGRARLRSSPVQALHWMEWTVLVPGGLAVVATAGLVWVATALDLPSTASSEAKSLAKVSFGVVSGFLAAGFLKAEEDFDGWVGERVRDAFQAKFKECFPPQSQGEQAVFSDWFDGAQGWGREARALRAAAIERSLPCP